MLYLLIVSVLLLGLVLVSLRFYKTQWKTNKLDAAKDCEKIHAHLCCYEFPWECYYGINFAFFRTFASPTISSLYHSTKFLEETSEKRVNDTDILTYACKHNMLQALQQFVSNLFSPLRD